MSRQAWSSGGGYREKPALPIGELDIMVLDTHCGKIGLNIHNAVSSELQEKVKLRGIVKDREAWHAAVHGVTQRWKGLSD